MKPNPKYDLSERIDLGIRIGVARALEAHRKAGEKVAVWRNGRVVDILPPKQRIKDLETEIQRALASQPEPKMISPFPSNPNQRLRERTVQRDERNATPSSG